VNTISFFLIFNLFDYLFFIFFACFFYSFCLIIMLEVFFFLRGGGLDGESVFAKIFVECNLVG